MEPFFLIRTELRLDFFGNVGSDPSLQFSGTAMDPFIDGIGKKTFGGWIGELQRVQALFLGNEFIWI